MTDVAPFAGAVLCGGASRRMGTDKALLQIGGRALARRVADALHAAGAVRVITVGGDTDALGALGLEAVADDHPGEGPLGGVLTALGARGDVSAVAVLACDLVHPSPAAIRTLVEHVRTDAVDVVVPVAGGRPQFHHAVWCASATAPLQQSFAGGERALRRAAAGLRIATVEGIDPAALADADDPAAFEAVARREPPAG